MFHTGYHIWELVLTTEEFDPDFNEYYGVGIFSHTSAMASRQVDLRVPQLTCTSI